VKSRIEAKPLDPEARAAPKATTCRERARSCASESRDTLGVGMRILRETFTDIRSIARSFCGENPSGQQVVAIASHDGSQVLVLSRMRQAADRHAVPLLGSAIRRLQSVLFGIEIARDVSLGEGVMFVHTVGVVIGGDSYIGDRVKFMGSNTIGASNKGGYPRIGNDVVIGAGARILGPVTIGDRATIGANAVVLCDVPAGAVAAGVPASVRMPGVAARSETSADGAVAEAPRV
jgi:serine O-acetyltransferase